MVYLEPTKFFESVLSKSQKFDEALAEFIENNPDQAQDSSKANDPADQEPRPAKPEIETFLTEIELEAYHHLMTGMGIEEDLLYRIYKHISGSELAQSRGMIIDQCSSIDNPSFAERLLHNGDLGGFKVDFVLELKMSSDEIERRFKTLKYSLKTNSYISDREIELIKRPKKSKAIRYEDEPLEEVDNPDDIVDDKDENLPEEILELLPKKEDIVTDPEFGARYENEVDFYNNVQYPIFLELISRMKKSYYQKINIDGLDVDQIAENIKEILRNFLRPYPTILDESSEYKDLLLQNRSGMLPPRRWSLWKQIDPVSLFDEYLMINGTPEFSIDYAGRVFVFINELNRSKFFQNPKKYLKEKPAVPKKFRVAIFGGPQSG
jgi:YHS domain-containing protein